MIVERIPPQAVITAAIESRTAAVGNAWAMNKLNHRASASKVATVALPTFHNRRGPDHVR